MPAVVRIKRRIDEEPHTAFVLNGKRRKLLSDENAPASTTQTDKDELSTVLKFAGTLEKQDDSATIQFAAAARPNKAAAKELVQQKSGTTNAESTSNRRNKLRQQAQQTAREQRFRVVNFLRTTLDEEENANDASTGAARLNEAATVPTANAVNSNQITIVDIESQQTQTSAAAADIQQPADSDIGYVYDLYVPENEQQAAYVDMMDDNYLSVCAVGEVVYEDCYNDEDDGDYDSEDSNCEDYFTNDYPDDEMAEGQTADADDELCQQMNKFMFDDDEEDDEFVNSSDDEDYNTFRDPYVHSVDADEHSFVNDVDFYNAESDGSAYERYRRRILRQQEGSDDDEADDDDEPFESASENGEDQDK